MNLIEQVKKIQKSKLTDGPIPIKTRVERLKAFKKAIADHEAEISLALKKDLGKSTYEAYVSEVGFILEELGLVIKHTEDWAQIRKVKTPMTLFPAKSFIIPEPYGVVLLISPWNYPFQLCIAPFIGAFAAGNRVVVKPSEFAVHTSHIMKKLITEVFKEDEALVVEGAVEETQTLLNQKFDYIFFTGSTNVGKVIMKAAAENLTPVTLELGGKSPCLIDKSADLDVAAKRCVWGKFINAGQTCVAPDYVLVPRKMQESFIEKMKFYLNQFYGSDSLKSPDYSRIINEKHFDRLMGLVDKSKIAIGGSIDRSEKFIEPMVLKDVSWSDKIMEDEIFGPLLPIIPYEDQNEAISQILNRPKPLAFYVFGDDSKRCSDIISKVPFGGGCVNDTVIHLANPHLPFGGVGTSGIGSYHGKKSFDTFTHYKSVLKQELKLDIPLRYPPYEGKLNWIKLLIR